MYVIQWAERYSVLGVWQIERYITIHFVVHRHYFGVSESCLQRLRFIIKLNTIVNVCIVSCRNVSKLQPVYLKYQIYTKFRFHVLSHLLAPRPRFWPWLYKQPKIYTWIGVVGGWVGGWVGKGGGAVRGRGRGQKHKHTIQTRQLNNMQQENIKLYKFFLKYLGLSDRVWCAVKYEQYSAKI